jgi:hypothetical protein
MGKAPTVTALNDLKPMGTYWQKSTITSPVPPSPTQMGASWKLASVCLVHPTFQHMEGAWCIMGVP